MSNNPPTHPSTFLLFLTIFDFYLLTILLLLDDLKVLKLVRESCSCSSVSLNPGRFESDSKLILFGMNNERQTKQKKYRNKMDFLMIIIKIRFYNNDSK